MTAEKRYMSAIPARIIASLPIPRSRAMPYMAAAASMAKRKAFPMTRRLPEKTPAPRMMAIDAPHDAADAMPRVKGLARGFRRTPCMTDPAIASPNPATIPKRTRCSRQPHMMPTAFDSIIRSGRSTASGKSPATIAR